MIWLSLHQGVQISSTVVRHIFWAQTVVIHTRLDSGNRSYVSLASFMCALSTSGILIHTENITK